MTPEQLKASILQYAIQGKLVEQRPGEGTGEELYHQIQEEKQWLIKAGKIKKEKPLPKIAEDEIPFDIPESWKWVRWGDLSQSIQYGYNAPAQERGRIKMVRISDIQGGKVLWDTVPYCDIKEDEILTYKLEANDILFARTGGTVGKSYLVREVPEEAIYAGYLIRTQYSTLLCADYMKLFMESQLYWNQLRSGTIATAQPNCNGKTLSKMFLPLPPLAEQKRIVAKIEELLLHVDRYAAAYEKLEQFNAKFPEEMKKSILQYAIQGKLVEQRPEEGTGEELYRQIQGEKKRLINASKIKKEKSLPEIAEDEKPFDIPESWKWVRFGDCITLFSGSDFKPNEYNSQQKGIPYITGASSLTANGVALNRWTETPRIFANLGDVLLVCKGSGYGKTVICDIEEAHIARQIMAIKKNPLLNMDFVQYFLNANFDFIKSKGQGVIPGVDRGSVLLLLFPLPPLAEQNRIVAKLKGALFFCKKLK